MLDTLQQLSDMVQLLKNFVELQMITDYCIIAVLFIFTLYHTIRALIYMFS